MKDIYFCWSKSDSPDNRKTSSSDHQAYNKTPHHASCLCDKDLPECSGETKCGSLKNNPEEDT